MVRSHELPSDPDRTSYKYEVSTFWLGAASRMFARRPAGFVLGRVGSAEHQVITGPANLMVSPLSSSTTLIVELGST